MEGREKIVEGREKEGREQMMVGKELKMEDREQ